MQFNKFDKRTKSSIYQISFKHVDPFEKFIGETTINIKLEDRACINIWGISRPVE